MEVKEHLQKQMGTVLVLGGNAGLSSTMVGRKQKRHATAATNSCRLD